MPSIIMGNFLYEKNGMMTHTAYYRPRCDNKQHGQQLCVCLLVSECVNPCMCEQANIFSVVYAWLGYVPDMAVSLCSTKALQILTVCPHRIMYKPSCIHSCDPLGHVVSLFGLQIMQQPACMVAVFVTPRGEPFMTSTANSKAMYFSINKTLKSH